MRRTALLAVGVLSLVSQCASFHINAAAAFVPAGVRPGTFNGEFLIAPLPTRMTAAPRRPFCARHGSPALKALTIRVFPRHVRWIGRSVPEGACDASETAPDAAVGHHNQHDV